MPFKFEKLQKEFISVYCAWNLICKMEEDIANSIRGVLPNNISDKIHSIGVEQDPDGFLQLTCNVFTHDLKQVKTALDTELPSFEWECYVSDDDFSYIWLRLDDNALYDIPFYLE